MRLKLPAQVASGRASGKNNCKFFMSVCSLCRPAKRRAAERMTTITPIFKIIVFNSVDFCNNNVLFIICFDLLQYRMSLDRRGDHPLY